MISSLFDTAFRKASRCSCPFTVIFIVQSRIHPANKTQVESGGAGWGESRFGGKYLINFSAVEEQNSLLGNWSEKCLHIL